MNKSNNLLLTHPYSVTPLDNFDWYEGAGVPTPCRDASHALSVVKGILERSLQHEHTQSKNPKDAEELFKRWDDFGDYPSIRPELDPPFDPSEYARQRAEEICFNDQSVSIPVKVICAADFPTGTQFFEVEGIPVAKPPSLPPLNVLYGRVIELSDKMAMKLAYEHQITPDKFDMYVQRSLSIVKEDEP